jgi:PAS domain-containing protein
LTIGRICTKYVTKGRRTVWPERNIVADDLDKEASKGGKCHPADAPEVRLTPSPTDGGSELCHSPPSSEDWEHIFNSMTDMVTIHDDDWNIICANKAAQKILGLPAISGPKTKCFKYYHGAECPPEGCPSCQTYKTGKTAAFEAYEPHLKMFIEIRAIPRLDGQGNVIGLIHIVRDITERKKQEEEIERHRNHLKELVEERTEELTKANEELQEAITKIKTLKGLIPICAWCKKIRDDKGYWNLLETYIKDHSDADFTHGICPECAEKFHKEAEEDKSS